MELGRFPSALRSRRGQFAELSLRAFLLCLVSLLLEKCPFLHREYLEIRFSVVYRRESDVDSLPVWREDLATWPEKLMS